MKLIELVAYFRKGGSFEGFCNEKSLDIEAEVVEIYMEKPFNLDNKLEFFEIEKTKGNIRYVSNGVVYFNLFDFYYFLDAIEESHEVGYKSISNDELAERLLHYAIYDA